MFKLYELTEMYQNILNLIDDGAENEEFTKALEQINDNLETKALSMARLVKSIDSNVIVLKEEEKRLGTRRKALENKVDNIKEYLQFELEKTGIDNIKDDLFSIRLQNNPPSVKFTDENLIPGKYKQIETIIKIPKKAILDDLKAGVEIAGVKMVQGRSLRII